MLKLLKKHALYYDGKLIIQKHDDRMNYATMIHVFKQKLDIITHSNKDSCFNNIKHINHMSKHEFKINGIKSRAIRL